MDRWKVDNNLLAVVDGIADPLLVLSKEYEILFMNRAAKETYGDCLAEAKPAYCYFVTHGVDRPCHEVGDQCPVKKVYETGERVTVVHRHSHDGKEFIHEITVAPIFDDNGQVLRVVEIVRDVTGSVLHEKISQQYEEMNKVFRHVEQAKREWEQSMDCIADIVIITNENDAILRANKPILTVANKPFLEILGKKWNELLLENGMRKSGEFEGDTEFHHAPSNRYFTVRIHTVTTTESETARAVTLHDITERKLITAELEQSNVQLESHRKNLQCALDELTVLIRRVITEKEFGVYFTLPPNLEQCWKTMKCEQQDCPCYGKEPLMCWQEAGTFCKGKVQGHFAEKYGDCEQCKHYQQSIADPTYQIGMQFNNMMKILEDKNKELADAYAELKNTQSQILQQEKMASIGQLAAGVAHEINNPVGFITSNIGSLSKYVDKLQQFINAQSDVIANYENFLATDELDALRKKLKIDFVLEDVKDLVRESLDGTERVKTIVQNLKNFSRVDQSEQTMADLNECVESTLNIVWNELKYKTTVNKEYGDIPLTLCYPQQLNQVFMNLLMNGAQAIKEKGEITIRTWSDGDNIYVSISDSGCGIPAENLDRLFEPFFTTKAVGKGTGLGLSIAYDIVTKKHGGELLVNSEVDKGTTFTVKIPVVEEKKAE